MDDIIVRSRYPRHSIHGRRRKRSAREDKTIIETILWQAAVSALVLLAVVAIKSLNTPVTNYITGKLQSVLFTNIELKNLYEKIDSILDRVRSTRSVSKEKSDIGGKAVPVSAGFNEAEFDGNAAASDEGYSLEGEDKAQEVEHDGDTVRMIARKHSFVLPVDGVLSSPFGTRIDPVTKEEKFHKGIDIEADSGVLIKASLDGEVIESGSVPTYGKYIKIRHDDGITTVYAHCSQLIAQKGQKVKQGEVIARVGDTGVAVGSHLHFEIWKDGKPLNPISFIKVPSD